jgi:RNA polymerase subunit RPABC4/transcription elongation factor Spt4
MSQKSLTRSGNYEGAKLIPWWSVVLAVGFFFAIQALLHLVLIPRDPNPKPLYFTVIWGILLGMFFAFYMLIIGYVTRDSKRRGMFTAMWVLIMISLLPSGVGFVVYFLLRQPVQMSCPHCKAGVAEEFNFCPSCQFQLNPVCDHCQRALGAGHAYCPHCGSAVSERQHLLAVR